MHIQEFIEIQKEFDKKHAGRFRWSTDIDENHLEILEFLMLGLMGEVGELANLIKKIIRGDYLLNEKRYELNEEVADIFIYLVKFCYQMDIDLEKCYLDKMRKNEIKFKKFKDK